MSWPYGDCGAAQFILLRRKRDGSRMRCGATMVRAGLCATNPARPTRRRGALAKEKTDARWPVRRSKLYDRAVTLDEEKTALRAELGVRRAAAEKAAPDAAQRLARHFPERLLHPNAIVAGYVKFRSEIDPLPLLRNLAQKGARLCLPRTPPRGTEAGVRFHLWREGAALSRAAFGVLEPAAEAQVVAPDIVLVPLLGVDRTGARLGYGQGHYDRTLSALRAQKPIVAVGLAYAAQEVSALPHGPHDQRLDWIVTEIEAIRCEGASFSQT